LRYKLIKVRFLFLLFLPFSLSAQFTYTIDQSVPVEVNGKTLLNPWAGGLNSAQVNTMDLNADGQNDLVLFDKTASKIVTFVSDNNQYKYAPQYEALFPDVSTFVVLRDYNCDGKKDLFTFGQIGVFVYKNVTQGGQPLTWKKLSFFNNETSLYSEVLLTKGFSMTNLLPGTNDLPNFADMDGDGDLDVLNMKFVSPSQAEYHKNFSMELYGTCDSLALVRQTQSWGDFLECSCGKVAFGGQTCADIGGRIDVGGRVEHTGGKALLTIDIDHDGDQDLFFSEESCSKVYLMENVGNATTAALGNLTTFPVSNPPIIAFYPSFYLEDVDFDGKNDLVVTPNISARSVLSTNFIQSVLFFKNIGTNQLPNFSLIKNNFLQEEMIDLGDNSAPAFFDFDQDGDEDMFVGQMTDENIQSSIAYYDNVGTSTQPSFRLVTKDFIGFSVLHLYNIKPQFVDVDGNGGTDILFTATALNNGKTSLYCVLSTSTNSSTFGGQTVITIPINLAQTENVTMVDVDQDGRGDLLIGRSNGSLEYWRHTANGITFSLVNDKYLGLDDTPFRQNLSVSAGDLDSDGRDDLVVGDQSGRISVYADFRAAGSAAQPVSGIVFDSFSNSYKPKNLGGKLRPVIVNLFGTDKPEIVTGNTLGGLYMLKNDNGQILADLPVISLSPNPLPRDGSLSIKADRNSIMEIFTTMGQRIGMPITISANQIIDVPIRGISAGLYIARFTAGSKMTAVRFIVM
jgi:hypothetical protein